MQAFIHFYGDSSTFHSFSRLRSTAPFQLLRQQVSKLIGLWSKNEVVAADTLFDKLHDIVDSSQTFLDNNPIDAKYVNGCDHVRSPSNAQS